MNGTLPISVVRTVSAWESTLRPRHICGRFPPRGPAMCTSTTRRNVVGGPMGLFPLQGVAQRADVWSDQVERRITPDEADGLASLSKLSRREDITWQEREAAAFYLAHMVAFRSDRAWSEMSPLAEQAVQAKRTQAAEGLLSDRYSKWLDRELREIRRGPQKGNSDLRSDLVGGGIEAHDACALAHSLDGLTR